MTKDTVRRGLRDLLTSYSFVVSFVVLAIIAMYFNPKFMRFSNLMTLLSNSSITGIIACGMTMIIISGQIDLSVGSIVALVSGIAVLVLNSTNSIPLTLLFCLTFGLLLGAVNGALVAYVRLAAFIATLATQSAYRSIITQIGQGGPFTVNKATLPSFSWLSIGKLIPSTPNLVLFFVVIAVIVSIILNRTKVGRYIHATGSNETATSLTGVKPANIKMFVFSAVGLLSGLAAFLLASRMSSVTASNAGSNYELDAIASVAIGGTSMSGGRGRVTGSFMGAIMMQMISTILIAAKVDPFLTGLVKGVIIIVAVAFQSANSRKNA